MGTEDQYRCFSLTHRPISSQSDSCYETSERISMTSCKCKLTNFRINPNNNIICAFNASSERIFVFPSPEAVFYTFRPMILSILEDILFVGNTVFILSRIRLIALYMLSIYSIEGELISIIKWRSMLGEGVFNRIDCSRCFPATGRMAVTEGVERIIVDTNLSDILVRDTTLRFYDDEYTGMRYSVRQLGPLTVAIHLQVINEKIYEYSTYYGHIICDTCELHHFLPEEDLPVNNRIFSVRTDIVSPLVYSINCLEQQLFSPVLQMIDTVTYSLSICVLDLVNGTKSIGIPMIVNLKEDPLHNAIKSDLLKITPNGIVLLSDGKVITFWNLENVAFILESKN